MTRFERALLNALVAGDTSQAIVLAEQVAASSIVDRRLFGDAGFVFAIEVPPSAPVVTDPLNCEISDVIATVGGMQSTCQFILFVRNGRLFELEGTTYEESWPTDVNTFSLTYFRQPRMNPILETYARAKLGIVLGE